LHALDISSLAHKLAQSPAALLTKEPLADKVESLIEEVTMIKATLLAYKEAFREIKMHQHHHHVMPSSSQLGGDLCHHEQLAAGFLSSRLYRKRKLCQECGRVHSRNVLCYGPNVERSPHPPPKRSFPASQTFQVNATMLDNPIFSADEELHQAHSSSMCAQSAKSATNAMPFSAPTQDSAERNASSIANTHAAASTVLEVPLRTFAEKDLLHLLQTQPDCMLTIKMNTKAAVSLLERTSTYDDPT